VVSVLEEIIESLFPTLLLIFRFYVHSASAFHRLANLKIVAEIRSFFVDFGPLDIFFALPALVGSKMPTAATATQIRTAIVTLVTAPNRDLMPGRFAATPAEKAVTSHGLLR
jgi:hypothetical protein